MRVSFQSVWSARNAPLERTSLLLSALAITCAVGCGEPDAADDTDMTQGPAQSGDGGTPDTGTAIGTAAPDAGTTTPDASTSTGGFDAGSVAPSNDAGSVDAGRADAGGTANDAGNQADASASADAGACGTLTYASFGMQFVEMYCAACHTGTRAEHGIRLDTLAGIQMNKAAVKRMAVTTTAMPPQNPRPNAADRQKLGQWLDCGPN